MTPATSAADPSVLARVEYTRTGLSLEFGGPTPVPNPAPVAQAPTRFSSARRPGGAWRAFRPRVLVEALRMVGPFEIEAADGEVVRCEDGWVVVTPSGLQAVPAETFSALFETA